MKTYNFFFICCIVCAAFASCRKPHYRACFTTSKDTFLVGENIWFYNCSDYDGGSTQNTARWVFEPDQTELIVTSDHDSISWVYNSAGVKNPKLSTGTKENADAITKQIIIKP
jgi:hypothetical protein